MPITVKIITDIPHIPPQVEPADLQSNGMLFTREEIEQIRDVISGDGRYRLVPLKDANGRAWYTKLRYAIIAISGECFAVYSGKTPLGEGGYGKVKLAQNLQTGKWHALKVQAITEQERAHIESERHLLEKLELNVEAGAEHQTVIMERRSVRKKRQQHYMLMKYFRGEALFDLAVNDALQLSPARWIKLILNLLHHVKSIHEKNVLHRDIKLENIIASLATDEIGLVDLGFAMQMDAAREVRDTERVGTACYVAPEIMVRQADNTYKYNEKSEVYSLGSAIALLLGLAWPHVKSRREGATMADKIRFYTDRQLRSRPGKTQQFDKAQRDELREYLRCMTDADPERRPTVDEAKTYFKAYLSRLKDQSLYVGLLDVEAYSEEMKEDLLKYDYVWLVDKKLSVDPCRYSRLRRELEICGVRVGDRLYVGIDARHLQSPLLEKLNGSGGDYKYKVESVVWSYLPDVSRFGIFGKYFSMSKSIKFDQEEAWSKSDEARPGVLSSLKTVLRR